MFEWYTRHPPQALTTSRLRFVLQTERPDSMDRLGRDREPPQVPVMLCPSCFTDTFLVIVRAVPERSSLQRIRSRARTCTPHQYMEQNGISERRTSYAAYVSEPIGRLGCINSICILHASVGILWHLIFHSAIAERV